MNFKRQTICLVLCLQMIAASVLQLEAEAAMPAHSSGPAGLLPAGNSQAPVALDLSSAQRNLTPGARLQGLIINEGGSRQTVGQGLLQMITPAERLAAYQMLSTGQQSIVLSNLGRAT